MNDKILRLLLPCLFLLAVSCQTDNADRQEPRQPQTPQTILKDTFLQKFRDNATLKLFISQGDTYVVSFNEGGTLFSNKADFEIVECTPETWPTISTAGGEWCIDKKSTGIPYSENASGGVAAGVYDGHGLYLWLTDGTIIFFHPEKAYDVGFIRIEAAKNPFLEKDIVCRTDGGTDVSVMMPSSAEASTIVVLTMGYRGTGLRDSQDRQLKNVFILDYPGTADIAFAGLDGKERRIGISLGKTKSIPVLRIATQNGVSITSKENYVNATITVEDPEFLYCTQPSQSLATQIRGRGNSSWWNMPKKSYKIKLDKKTRLLGMSNDKEWALLANYADKTLLRNAAVFAMSEILGMKWTPKFRPVEVWLNGSYLGQYMLTEHVKVSDERVDITVANIADNSGEAITGGYFLEIDERLGEDKNFKTAKGIPVNFKDPKLPTDAQFKYVRDYFATAEEALYGEDFADPETGYANYIDRLSFVHNYIVQELTRNVDGNMRLSNFLIKERGGKIAHSHVWDFDLALGNCDYISSSPQGYHIKSVRWYIRLLKDPEFISLLKQEWQKLYAQLYKVESTVRDMAILIDDAQTRNFQKWKILNTKVWPNPVALGSYSAELEYMLTFLRERAEWLNAEITNM